MASRWARALKFIWSQRQHWTDWETFVDQHRGIAGCARAMALAKKKAPWPVDDKADELDSGAFRPIRGFNSAPNTDEGP
jgi:hypothetical protein